MKPALTLSSAVSKLIPQKANEVFDQDEDVDEFGLIPNTLDGVEKTASNTRRRTTMKMNGMSFKNTSKGGTYINAKDITSLVKSRFMGQIDQISNQDTIEEEIKRKQSER